MLLSTFLFSPSKASAVGGEAKMEESDKKNARLNAAETIEKNSKEEIIRECKDAPNFPGFDNTSERITIGAEPVKKELPQEIPKNNTSKPSDARTSVKKDQLPSKHFLELGYLPLHVKDLKTIAGDSRGIWSSTYNRLIAALEAYENLPGTATMEEKLLYLSQLQGITKEYLRIKEESFFKEGINARYSSENIKRASARIEACSLLLNGIELERGNLESGENNDQPRQGIRLDRTDKLIHYQKDFASGNLSSLGYISVDGKVYLFKQLTNKLLPELTAEQLGFSEQLINNGGVSEITANLSGRELATYQIAKELSKSTGLKLVPKVFPAALGEKPNQIIGNAIEFIEGEQLFKERIVKVPKEEINSLFSSENLNNPSGKNDRIIEYMAEVALGESALPSEWKFRFPHDLLEQVSSEQPLHEGGRPISFERAYQLAEQGAFSFEKREIFSVNQDINFREPLLQKTLNQLQLVLLLALGLDDNETNFIFFQDPDNNWRVISIDHDLSWPSNITKVSDEIIDKLKHEKEAKHMLLMPLLVDQAMGEALLKLTPEILEQLFNNTKFTTAQIEAAKSRLESLQEYIREAKSNGRYVFDKECAEAEEVDKQPKEKLLTWGEETYELQKEDPNRSYIGKLLKTREYLTQKLESTLRVKIALQREKLEEETKKLHDLLSALDQVRDQQKTEPKDKGPSLNTIVPSRSDSISSIETGHTILTSLVPSLSPLAHVTTSILYNNYLTLQKELRKRGITISSTFVEQLFKKRLLLEDEEQQKAIFKTNQLLQEAEESQKAAEDTFKKLIEEISSDLNDSQSQWIQCIEQFNRAENALSFAITSFEDEEKVLPKHLVETRRPYQKEAQHNKEQALASIVWGQIYRTEKAASIAFKKEGRYSEEVLHNLLEAQQAWRILFSNISPSFPEGWKSHFTIAESLKDHFTSFFPHWLEAANTRYQAKTASSNIELSIKNSTEQKHWEKLNQLAQDSIGTPKGEMERGLWKRIIQEIDFQKIYALAQEKLIHVDDLKQTITNLSMGELVHTEAHLLKNGNMLFSPLHLEDVTGGNTEKLQELCNFWHQYKERVSSKKKAWRAVIEYASEKLPKLSHLTQEKPLEEQNNETLEASFLFNANNALDLVKSAEGEFSKIENNSAPLLISHRLDHAIHINDFKHAYLQLCKAREKINHALYLSKSYETTMWKPSFPMKKLERLEEINDHSHRHNQEGLQEKNHEQENANYVIVNVFEEEVMKSFLNQIDQFPNSSQFKASLSEMVHGEPDFIASLIESLNKFRNSINAKLEQMED